MVINAKKTNSITLAALSLLCLLLLTTTTWAQRRPTIIEPQARTGGVTARPVNPAPPTKGTLTVLLDPEVPGQISIETLAGKLVDTGKADERGQADFVLKRGQAYKVKAIAPGFDSNARQSKILKASDTVLLRLTAKSATVNLVDLPAGAQVFIDDQPQPRAVIDKTGATSISDLAPGTHKLKVKHPDFRDFNAELPVLKAGTTMIYPVALDKTAQLTITGLPGATVLIDGALEGKIPSDGKLTVDYVIEQASEHTINVELLGYQTWSQKLLLAPGARAIAVKLDPVVTSAGVTDFFETLTQWKAPASWKITTAGKRLEVSGAQLGTLKDRTYRDFEANFLVWLGDGKGATWAVRADREGRNYYLFHLAGPNATARTPGRFYTYLVTDGGAPQEVSTPIPLLLDLNAKTSYTINIRATGHSVQHKLTANDTAEEVTLGTWTDTTATRDKFLYGTFGFCALADEIFTVDDFTLELSKEP